MGLLDEVDSATQPVTLSYTPPASQTGRLFGVDLPAGPRAGETVLKGRPPKSHVTPSRKIWVDADTCPPSILEVLFRVADGRRLVLTLVASQPQQWPHCAYIRSLVVPPGADAVTNRIDAMINEGDLVITGDMTLTQSAARKKVETLDPCGEPAGTNQADMQQAAQKFMQGLHDAANMRRAPEALRQRNQLVFASQLDDKLSLFAIPYLSAAAPAR